MKYSQERYGGVDVSGIVSVRTRNLLDEMAKEKSVSRSAMINAILKRYTEKYAEKKHTRGNALSV